MSGRKRAIVRIPPAFGRDAGKVFVVEEMSAMAAEKWATRMFLLFGQTGAQMPERARSMGMVGIAILGLNIFFKGSVDPDKLEPLLDQMLTCIKIIRDPVNAPELGSELVSDDDIEEVRTIMFLRSEVIRVHTDFSPAEALWQLISEIQAPKQADDSSNT